MDLRILFSRISHWIFRRAIPLKLSYLAVLLAITATVSLAQTAPLAITVSGPYSFKDTPAVPGYKVTVTNTSQGIVSSIAVSHVLSASDGSYLITAQPSQGTCDPGGQGVITLSCSIGSLNPGASSTVDVAAQMVSGDVAFSASATGFDGSGASFSTAPAQRTTLHGNPPAGTTVVSISLSANPTPKDLVGGRSGTLSWNLQNSNGIAANQLVFAMVTDNRMSIRSASVAGSNSTDPVSCSVPVPGDSGTNVVFCNIDYLGGSSSAGGGGGGNGTVTQLQVNVNYVAPIVSAETTLSSTGYVSFDGTDSSNPAATGQVRVKP
ncbi:MAG TPA: hypothetical protein VFP59_19285 [Candidatus Angelobacter sp.]|nr:hypothetical protein [Candidatus Angelobacter sp.]